MKETIDEQISAWMDGELPAEQQALLLARLQREPGLRARWDRYHLIADALHCRLPDRLAPDLADRVMAALDDEPPARGGRHLRWLRPLGGAAIAASVALAAVLVAQRLDTPSAEAPGATLAAAPAADQFRRVAGTRWQGVDRGLAERLNPYLVNHSEYAVRAGFAPIAPHVRIAGYDQGPNAVR